MKKIILEYKCVMIILFMVLYAIIPWVSAQPEDVKPFHDIAHFLKSKNITEKFIAAHITKKPGHYTKQDWAQVIDNTWGQGLPTTEKLRIFDEAWDEKIAGYSYWDRDSHTSSDAVILGQLMGSGSIEINYDFSDPQRIVFQIKSAQ